MKDHVPVMDFVLNKVKDMSQVKVIKVISDKVAVPCIMIFIGAKR